MTDAAIIDETFAGLTAPLHAIPCGREDLSTRPGDALVALVSEFSAEGGFRRLAEQRRPKLRIACGSGFHRLLETARQGHHPHSFAFLRRL